MRVTYIVESLEELAAHFESLAADADSKARPGPKTKDGAPSRTPVSSAGAAWREAARIVRHARIEPERTP